MTANKEKKLIDRSQALAISNHLCGFNSRGLAEKKIENQFWCCTWLSLLDPSK